MIEHHLEPAQASLASLFALAPPALTVESGDIIKARTLDIGWGLEAPTSVNAPRRRFEPRGDGPCLVGPIAVMGAEPGDTLEIRILSLEPGPYGYTYAGGPGFTDSYPNQSLGLEQEPLRLVKWDLGEGWARSDLGYRVPLRPFLGMVGLATDPPGNPWHPGAAGGNLDCRDMVAGSTLFLPVQVEGALLYLGDGHAAQGHGEVSGTAIECPMESARLQILVRRDLPRRSPLLWTRGGWATFGFSPDLNQAATQALDGMLEWMRQRLDLPRTAVLALASACVDLHITQMVNGVRGVHAFWPESSCSVQVGQI